MLATQTPLELLAELAQRGFSLRAVAGKIEVIPASRLTTDDREAIGKSRADLLAILSPGEPWNAATAIRLMADADALVERLGVSGQRPEVADAATMVSNAFATQDMETLRFAVGLFTLLVRKLAQTQYLEREQQCSG